MWGHLFPDNLPYLPYHRNFETYHVGAVVRHSLDLPSFLLPSDYGNPETFVALRFRFPDYLSYAVPRVDALSHICLLQDPNPDPEIALLQISQHYFNPPRSTRPDF